MSIDQRTPKTNQTLTLTKDFTDPDGDTLTYTYAWTGTHNGTTTTVGTGASLDLSEAGNGDKGDVISVAVYATDSHGLTSSTLTDSVTIQNSAPTGTASLGAGLFYTNDTLTATPTFTDADGDPLTYTYVWTKNASTTPLTAVGGTPTSSASRRSATVTRAT